MLNRFRQRLWVRPLAVSVVSIGAAFIAKLADDSWIARYAPEISADSIEALLSIMAASMLVIATFSVASMVSAYASASSTATPRSFTLVVADDASQNALSTFVGAFIFSVVALTAVKNDYFSMAGYFILFVLTVVVFAIVIVTFVKWVDRIARLGRMSSTIDKVETAAAAALKRRRDARTLCGVPVVGSKAQGEAVFAARVGYVQHVDMAVLQAWAVENDARLAIAALPGSFVTPDRAIAYLRGELRESAEIDSKCVAEAFQVGDDRLFEDDPRFGLIVLSEIAGRALSPAVNDPGTAIDIVGTLLRLFVLWNEPAAERAEDETVYDRVEVPEISVRDMLDDAFTAIARDGAASVEVSVRLQKALRTLEKIGDAEMRDAALYHRRLALKRASSAMSCEEDLEAVRGAADESIPVNG